MSRRVTERIAKREAELGKVVAKPVADVIASEQPAPEPVEAAPAKPKATKKKSSK